MHSRFVSDFKFPDDSSPSVHQNFVSGEAAEAANRGFAVLSLSKLHRIISNEDKTNIPPCRSPAIIHTIFSTPRHDEDEKLETAKAAPTTPAQKGLLERERERQSSFTRRYTALRGLKKARSLDEMLYQGIMIMQICTLIIRYKHPTRPVYFLVSLQLCQKLAFLCLDILRHCASDASDSVVGLWKCKKALNIHDKSGEVFQIFACKNPFGSQLHMFRVKVTPAI